MLCVAEPYIAFKSISILLSHRVDVLEESLMDSSEVAGDVKADAGGGFVIPINMSSKIPGIGADAVAGIHVLKYDTDFS